MKRYTNSAFTMIEAMIVMSISILLAGIAIPIMSNAMKSFQQTATVSAATGAISATRFQAIMQGYPYQIVFTSSSLSYQIFTEVPPATTFSLVTPAAGSATTPLPNAGGVSMTGTTFTYTFSANGTVTSVANPSGTALQIKNTVKSNTIAVSGVGNVSTSSP